MKTYSILFIVIAIIHTTILINITIFNGEWNGLVLFISNILFLIAAVYYGIERRANKKSNS
ncbi:hypothetical protein ACFFHM_09355 [Halalkalibacter kiskunsagensis]|uniref:Uncharacterized protein n=1 Tax=Halalkalibacter kiskunsagensis TaxID=1548599 RepID=A0ABV6KBK5_9BACI